ncbi:uncharacterized protein LOC114828232 [Galendromus occidentalis]|uniref:Uncharacterized protein LOC114828232 n=1 Tax=Galendromus occidentalis TaxID=34638 RepID=A0AAJ7SFW8_9ACAR|nr:uncharacterized protein LOC114828232 [Galendromus occidentalis]
MIPDVGGHGALIELGQFKLQPTRKYHYRFAATGCPSYEIREQPMGDIAAVGFDPQQRSIIVGKSEGGIIHQDPDSSESRILDFPRPTGIKVQDFRTDCVTVGVASRNSVAAFRGAEIVAKVETPNDITSFDLSPYIQSELLTCSRRSVILGDETFELKLRSIPEDVVFFTHPRHLAVVYANSVIHCDARTPKTTSKIADTDCMNLLPMNCFSFAKLNCKNVNQLLVLSIDSLSVWDVRYSIQPMGVYNHYVPRAGRAFGMQTLQTEDSLLVLVQSNSKSTLFEFDPSFPSPSAMLLGPQMQFGSPPDIGLHYWDQTGKKLPDDIWKRLTQPIAGSCIVPSRDNPDEFSLHSFTETGDWFKQRILRRPEDDDSVAIERTFAYGLDEIPMNADQRAGVEDQVKKLLKDHPTSAPLMLDPTVSLGRLRVIWEDYFFVNTGCPVCSPACPPWLDGNPCLNCGLGEAAKILNDAWLEGGLMSKNEELTEEEESRFRELLSQNAGGYQVSDSVKAAWGEVDWRVTGEAVADVTLNDADAPGEAEEQVDIYDDDGE